MESIYLLYFTKTLLQSFERLYITLSILFILLYLLQVGVPGF